MHRHGYQGRKLQRATGQRTALLRGQLTSLVLHEAIVTTEAKAKEVAPRFERLVTYAKKGDLASARLLRRELLTENAVIKLLSELKPAFDVRQGGYTRIIKLANRRGDNAPMVQLSLVLEGKDGQPQKAAEAKASVKKPAAKKSAAKVETVPETQEAPVPEAAAEKKVEQVA